MQMIFPLLPQNVANAKGKKNSSMPRNLFHLISYKLLQIKWGLKCRLNSGKNIARGQTLFPILFLIHSNRTQGENLEAYDPQIF